MATKYGLALTTTELAELNRRATITENLGPLEAAASSKASFAGLWFDQRRGGLVVVQTTDGETSMAALVAAFLPAGAAVQISRVAYGLRDLRALQGRVEADIPAWRERGVIIAAVGVDIPSNRLSIEVEGLQSDVKAVFANRYGPLVAVSEGRRLDPAACLSRSNCGVPKKGGITITSSTGEVCTSAILGHSTTATVNVITAGHCIRDGGGTNTSWLHNGVNWGNAIGYVYPGAGQTSDIDIGIISTVEAGTKNLVFQQNVDDIEPVTAELTNAGQGYGTTVCRAGRTSGFSCGTVVGTLETRTYSDGATVRHLWEMTAPVAAGDSGGPMTHYNPQHVYIAGITSAGGGGHSFYTTIQFAKSYYGDGLRACITAGC